MSTTSEREHVDPSRIFVAPDGNGNRCIWYADVEHGLPVALLAKSDAKADGFESLAAVVALHHGRAWRDRVALDPDLCGLCKQPATGLASIGDTRYCHGDNDASPTCYEVACWRETGRVSSPMDMGTRPGLCACGRPGCCDRSDTLADAQPVSGAPERITPCRRSPVRDRWECITWPDKPTAYPCVHDHSHCDYIGCVEHVDGMHVDKAGDAIVHVSCDRCVEPPSDPAGSDTADEREALAKALAEVQYGKGTRAAGFDIANWVDFAAGLLASDWLAAHDAALVADAERRMRAQVAKEITTERDRIKLGSTVDFRAGMRFAADIAARAATKAVSES